MRVRTATRPQSCGKRTWIVIELDPESATTTTIQLTHLDFGAEPHWDEMFEYFQKAWAHVLSQLKANLEAEG